MLRRPALLLIPVACLVPLACEDPAAPEPEPSTLFEIAYIAETSSDPYRVSLRRLLSDGTGESVLIPDTEEVVIDRPPVWSPDGSKMLVSLRSTLSTTAPYTLYVLGAEGNRLAQLTSDQDQPQKFSFSWSPDGTRVSYEMEKAIYVARTDGSGVIQIAGGSNQTFRSPAWSPTGDRIAYVHGSYPTSIRVMNADGTGSVQLTDSLGYDFYPIWSPDGTRIAFSYHAADTTDARGVAVVNADGSGLRRLVSTTGHVNWPSWSPDGSRIAYTRTPPGTPQNHEVFVVNVDGSDLIQVTDSPGFDGVPLWSPDSKHIVFQSARVNERHDLFSVDADGSNLRQLTTNPERDGGAAISPRRPS